MYNIIMLHYKRLIVVITPHWEEQAALKRAIFLAKTLDVSTSMKYVVTWYKKWYKNVIKYYRRVYY